MLDPLLLGGAVLAGFVVAATPGPAVLALIGIGATEGRGAATRFLSAHFVGDTLWAIAALLTLAWASGLAEWILPALAWLCAAYLAWLGIRALLIRRRADGAPLAVIDRPLWRGFVLGITNPKSYPLAVSMLAAVGGGELANLSPWAGAAVVGAYLLGFVLGDAFDVWLVGTSLLRRAYLKWDLAITRLSGLVFVGFAVQTVRGSAG